MGKKSSSSEKYLIGLLFAFFIVFCPITLHFTYAANHDSKSKKTEMTKKKEPNSTAPKSDHKGAKAAASSEKKSKKASNTKQEKSEKSDLKKPGLQKKADSSKKAPTTSAEKPKSQKGKAKADQTKSSLEAQKKVLGWRLAECQQYCSAKKNLCGKAISVAYRCLVSCTRYHKQDINLLPCLKAANVALSKKGSALSIELEDLKDYKAPKSHIAVGKTATTNFVNLLKTTDEAFEKSKHIDLGFARKEATRTAQVLLKNALKYEKKNGVEAPPA